MNIRKVRLKNRRYNFLFCVLLLFNFYSCKEKTEKDKEENGASTSKLEDGFVSIFNGENLEDWLGDSTYWRVESGNLVGEVTPETILNRNTFIIWQGGKPDDFELKLEYRISELGNSGINYRSDQLDTIPFALRGYQADIDGRNRHTGQNYEERKRTTLAYRGEKTVIHAQPNSNEDGSLKANVKKNVWQSYEVVQSLGDRDSLSVFIQNGDWNKCHLVVKGNHMQHFINGVLMSDVTDEDTVNRRFSGLIGVQVHVGPPMKVEYRDIRLKTLPKI